MTIRKRLTLYFTALLLLTLCLFDASVYLLTVGEFNRNARAADEVHAREVVRISSSDGGNGDFQGTGMDLFDRSLPDAVAQSQDYLEIHRPDAAVATRSTNLNGRSLLERSALSSSQVRVAIREVSGIGPVFIVAAPLFERGQLRGYAVAGHSLVAAYRTAAWLRNTLGVMTVAATAIAAVGCWWLAGIGLRPVDRITRAARSISAGALSRRLALRGPDDEIHRLGSAFDEMIARIERAFVRERQFTADVAHELRTPLTILQGEIEVTLRKPRSADEYRDGYERLHVEVVRLSLMLRDLLFLARVDAGVETLAVAPIDLCMVLTDVVDRFAGLAEERQITIRLIGPERAIVATNVDALSRAVGNLVENALRHSRRNDVVDVGLSIGDGVSIDVVDRGSGIAAEHLPHVFRRFYRADKHRGRDDGGSGLGLAIAASIVELLGGNVGATSRPLERTVFTIWLPARAAGTLPSA